MPETNISTLKRLLFITQDFPPELGGIQTYSMEHAQRLYRQIEHFAVIAPQKSNQDEVDAKLLFPVERLPSSNAMLFRSLYKNLPGLVHKYGAQHTFHAQWQTALPAIKLRQAGKLKRVFCAAHARELFFNPFQKWPLVGSAYEKRRRRVIQEIDHFFPVSDYTAHVLVDKYGIPKSRIDVVINGTNPELFFPKAVDSLKRELQLEDKKVILSLARLVHRKGIDLALKALAPVLKTNSDLVYLIAGDGSERQALERLSRELEITSHVHFLGKIPYLQLNDYLNLADVFVMTPRSVWPDIEGFGIVYLEANACGKAVIGSRSGGVPSAIKHEFNGLLIDEGSKHQLQEACLRLLNDDPLRNTLGTNGLEWVRREANWNSVSQLLFEKMQEAS